MAGKELRELKKELYFNVGTETQTEKPKVEKKKEAPNNEIKAIQKEVDNSPKEIMEESVEDNSEVTHEKEVELNSDLMSGLLGFM